MMGVVESISKILYNFNDNRFEKGKKYKDLFDQNAIKAQTSAIVDIWSKYAFELKHLMRFTDETAINFYKDVISHGIHASGDNDEITALCSKLSLLKQNSIGSVASW